MVIEMKLRKLVKEFDELLDGIEKQQEKYDKQRKGYQQQLKENKKLLLKRLKTSDDKTNRKKIKRDLHAVEMKYSLLCA
jgi:DNA-binding transcriptional regulator WhiA